MAQNPEYKKKWRAENQDKVIANRKKWIAENPKWAKEYTRIWREKNKEKIYANIKKWRENNPDKVRAQHRRQLAKYPERYAEYVRKSRLKNKYGLTLKEYEELVQRQGGKCAICKKKSPKLCVDHDHSTGKVRGALCTPCNTGLGFFRDDIVFLENAITYLNVDKSIDVSHDTCV